MVLQEARGSGAMSGEIDGWMHGAVRIVLRGTGLRRNSISMSMTISLVVWWWWGMTEIRFGKEDGVAVCSIRPVSC